MSRYYITTAIDYSNGDPHLGHAFEKIGADAIARYRRLSGDDVKFVIGMDEHSQTILQPAADAGLSVETQPQLFKPFLWWILLNQRSRFLPTLP